MKVVKLGITQRSQGTEDLTVRIKWAGRMALHPAQQLTLIAQMRLIRPV
jgi:hypothetical protein